jgi:KEOPS complex subunit Cgi121
MNNKYNIQIAGFKHEVENFTNLMDKINTLSDKCIIQLLNASGIAGYQHIVHATVHAINAFNRKENIAKDLGIEICVRASAQRQISKALDILGIKNGKMEICVVAVDCNDNIMDKLEIILDKREDSVLDPHENTLKDIYKISDIEIKTAGNIQNVMMERTALLILET